MLAAQFGTGQVFWSMLWFFLFFIWIWLLITVFADIFRSHDMGGFAKFVWVIFVIFLPYLGVFVYLIARGHKMSEHAMEAAQAQDAAPRAYIQQAAGTDASPADELARLADLKAQGVINDAEFAADEGQGRRVPRRASHPVRPTRGVLMTTQFNGEIAVDIRDSTPDWAPYLAPKAPEGAPNVLFLAWDDLGYATMDIFGGPVELSEHAPPRGPRREARELPHDRAVFAHTRVAPDRPQRDVERHGDDRGVRVGVPGHLDAHPVRERLHLRSPRRAGLQHLLRRQVAPHARRGMQPRRVQGPVAARPRLRALLRLARRRDEQLVSRPRPRQPPDRSARPTRGRLPPRRRPRRQRDRVHPRRQGDRPGQAVLHVPRAAGRPRPTPGAGRMDRQVQGQVRRRLRGDPRRHPREADRARPAARRHRALRRSTRTASRPAPAPTDRRGRCSTRSVRGTR